MRPIFDAIARGLARLLLRVFFRRIEVEGADHVPPRGPVLFVANHGNSLIDPFLLVGFLPRMARFLAKSTLWSNPTVRPFLELGGVIPVYRRADGVDTSRNDETFARCHETLAAGGAVALFPEGLSHDEPELQPLRTGAARIALGAGSVPSPQGVGARPRIVPVGLTFEDKTRFRSRVLIVIGEPIELPPTASDEAAAVRALTERIDAGLRRVTLNHPSWQVAKLVERAVDIYASDAALLPRRPDLAERFSLRRAFGGSYDRVRAKDPERLERLERAALRYDGMLEALGVRDDQVTARTPWTHVLLYVTDRASVLALTLPLAVVGTVLNWLPYRASGWVASRVHDTPDLPATFKLMTGFFLAPVAWLLEATVAGVLWGPWPGVAVGFAAPATGWVALRFHERNAAFWTEVWAWLSLRLRPARAAELRARRRAIKEELERLVVETQGDAAP
jgi:glycerol-3-phosphate O-acyltransferase/dihydroxyacetone phosphate acyltransferase